MKNGNKWITVFSFVFLLFMLTVDIAYNPVNLTHEKNPVSAIREGILTDSDVDSDMDGWSDDEEIAIGTDPSEPGPFLIDGDAELAAMAAWHEWDGKGTKKHPYIIENYYIDVADADVSCIEIRNIFSTYFIVRDCEVTGASGPYAEQVIPFVHARAGIYLNNTRYAEVTNNLVYGNCYGIRIDESYAVVIEENTCYSNNWEGIAVILDSTQCIVTDNICFDNIGFLGNGIGVGVGAYDNLIVHNHLYDNLGDEGAGIHLFLGYDNTITQNDCHGNNWGIAVRGQSSGNQILENHCESNGVGIFLSGADSNIISRNTCPHSTSQGISIQSGSDSNWITENNCSFVTYNGVRVADSSHNVIENNVFEENGYGGVALIGSSYNTVENNQIFDGGLAAIFLLESFENEISRNHGERNSWGVYLDNSDSNTITENEMNFNSAGVFMSESDFNTIIENTLIGNVEDGAGIYLYASDSNTIIQNTCTDNEKNIWLQESNENEIIDNSISGSVLGGIAIWDSTLNLISNNFCTENGLSGIYLQHSTKNTITENTCTHNVYGGITLAWSDLNTVVGNEVIGNGVAGIALEESDDNTLSGNTAGYNEHGFYLIEASHNLIFHNNILYNTIQATDTDSIYGNFWYNPDIQEGNYWSDYPGVDDGSGTGKHSIAGDLIGDTEIPWPVPGFDEYPLMIPTSLQEMIEVIKSKLHDLVDSGVMEENDVTPLIVKLDAAIGLIDRGKMFQASQKLSDFIDQINALINSGHLPAEEGEDLIAQAQQIIDVLLII